MRGSERQDASMAVEQLELASQRSGPLCWGQVCALWATFECCCWLLSVEL